MSTLQLHNIYDILDDPRLRRGFIRGDETLNEIGLFLAGYHLALQVHDVDEDFQLGQVGPFCEWLSGKYRTERNAGWFVAVEQLIKEGESPFDAFFRLLNAFREDSASPGPAG